ncbi:bacterio-opsin activator domain-containing protein [Natrononativus amylolyticus]|uniref:bacterio-opsin activator domain-containing protein n=1 Tax=Natrononativus amylolyticus TaxID=2963434 RepID=UPI0020CDA8C4|nr:bacterio-opsin activator domain-containing protein [Natrononativus amylolyticus]
MSSDSLTPALRETRALFAKAGIPLTTTEVAADLDLGRRSTYERLERLVERGELETKKVGSSARVWWRNPPDRDDTEDATVARRSSSPTDDTAFEVDTGAELLQLALEAADIGIWELDLETEASPTRSPHHDRIFGYDEPLEEWGIERFLEHVHRDDRERVARSLDEAFETGEWALRCRIIRRDGERRWIETHGGFAFEDDEPVRAVGTVRDITERTERERALEETRRQYRTLVEHFPNGAVALVDEACRYLSFGGTLEGNTSVPRTELEGKPIYDVLPPAVAEVVGPHYEAALEGDSATFEATIDDRSYRFHFVPVRDDDGEVFAAMGMSQDVTEQKEREALLRSAKSQLEALNSLHEVVSDITDAVIEQSSREEIEEIVCQRLADSESYTSAWIGDVDVRRQVVTIRAGAGVEDRVDETTITVDPSGRGRHDPEGRALREGETRVLQNAGSDSGLAGECGFEAAAAIPIAHGGTHYGVLCVYTDRPNAFTDDERAVIGQLGEVVGHAIAAIERQRALLSDEVRELEFQINDFFAPVAESPDVAGTITHERAVPAGDGVFLEYGTVTGAALEAMEAAVASDAVPHWQSVQILRTDGETRQFELTLVDPPMFSTITGYGGYIEAARIEDGDYYMRVHLPPSADVRHVVESIREAYPGVELVSQRQVDRGRAAEGIGGVVFDLLTDRQRTSLEVAYYAGYFAWPRDSTGEEVADSLGVAAPTFHQHLRTAQRRLIRVVFDDADAA